MTIVGPLWKIQSVSSSLIIKLELTEEVHKYNVAEILLIKNLSPALSKNEGLDYQLWYIRRFGMFKWWAIMWLIRSHDC